MAAKNAWSETSIIRELNQLSASKTSTPLVSSVKRRNPKRNNSNSSNLGICSPMVLRKIKVTFHFNYYSFYIIVFLKKNKSIAV